MFTTKRYIWIVSMDGTLITLNTALMCVFTACLSGLVARHYGMGQLQHRECTTAVLAGVNMVFDPAADPDPNPDPDPNQADESTTNGLTGHSPTTKVVNKFDISPSPLVTLQPLEALTPSPPRISTSSL